MTIQRPEGQSLVEILLAIAVFVIGMVTLGVLVIDGAVTERRSVERLKAVTIAREGLEAARSIRDNNFGGLPPGTYGLSVSGTVWMLSATPDTQDGFTRTLEVGNAGADYRPVTSTVTWQFAPGQNTTVTLASLLSNWRKTTLSWSTPDIYVTTTFGSVAALAVAVSGNRLYVTTPQNPTAPEFYIYDISNEIAPILKGQLELGITCFSLGVSGTRAYVASDNNPDEVKIVDVSSSTNPNVIGSIKLTGNQNVNSISVRGNKVHFVRDVQGNQATYYIYDVTDLQNPSLSGSLNLGDGGYDFALRDSSPPYAFFATQDNSQEFKTVNISDFGNMAVGGGLNLGGSEDLHGMAVSGTLAYGASLNRSGTQEFFIFDVSTPTAPTNPGSVEIGADINRLQTKNNLAFLATASTTNQFIVVNIQDAASPSILSKLPLAGKATGIAISPSGDYAYVTTDNPGLGLYVIGIGS